MKILPNGQVEIQNFQTGEKRIISPGDLPNYGIDIDDYIKLKKLSEESVAPVPASPAAYLQPTQPAANPSSYMPPPPPQSPVQPERPYTPVPQQAQPSQPQASYPPGETEQRKGILETLGGGVVDLGKSLLEPFRGIAADTVDIGKYLLGGGEKAFGPQYQNPFRSEEELNKTRNRENPAGFVEDQARKTAGIASYAVPFGKAKFIGSKYLVPGLAAGGLKEVSEQDATAESVAGAALLGAGTGGFIQGAGKLIGKAAQGISKGSDKAAKSLAVKGLRPSPSQQVNFYKETGTKLDAYLIDKGLAGANYQQIDDFIQPIQNQFDEIANSSDLLVQVDDVAKSFNKEISRLTKSILPTDKNKAEALKVIRDNFVGKYGKKVVPASQVTSLRKEIDAGIRDFNLDPAVKGPVNITRDVLQESVRSAADKAGIKAAGKTLRELGQELSKLYRLQEIAERQQFLGQGGIPAGLTQLLGGIVGAPGGLIGIAGGMAGATILNSPKVVQGAAKNLSRLSNISKQLPSISANPIGQGAVQTAHSAVKQNNQSNQNKNTNGEENVFQSLPPIESIPQDVNDLQTTGQSSNITGYSQEQLAQAYAKAIMSNDKKAADQLKNLYDVETAYQKTKTTKPTKLSEGDKKFAFAGQEAKKALALLEQGIESGPIQSPISKFQEMTGTQPKNVTEFKSKMAIARTAARNALLGANMSDKEIESLLDFTFDFSQPTPILTARIKSFIDSMDSYQRNIAGPETNTLPQITAGE